ncbi:hypothetical protein BsWGS_11506 [Bradybaena similaris]
MASSPRRSQKNFQFLCLRHKFVAYTFVVIVSTGLVVSKNNDSLATFHDTNNEDTASAPPDVTYHALPDGAPPPALPDYFESPLDEDVTDPNTSWQTDHLPSSPKTFNSWSPSSNADVSTAEYVRTSTEEDNYDASSSITKSYVISSSSSKSTSGKSFSPNSSSLTGSTGTSSTEALTTQTTSESLTSVDRSDRTEPLNPVTDATEDIFTSPPISPSEESTADITTEVTDSSSGLMLSTTPLLSTASSTVGFTNLRFCNRTRSSTYFTRCGFCFEAQSCYNGDIPAQDSVEPCRLSNKIPGCKVQCLHIAQESACCQGYWGDNCDECPGGYVNPCNGHGECQASNGTCLCQPGFTGTACELCDDETKYGANCSEDCSCVHGVCNNGVLGDGSCACDSGYKGAICDVDMPECEGLFCYNSDVQDWRCADVNGTAACICAVGYVYTADVHRCLEHNPCEDPVSPCGKNGVCDYKSPGKHKCRCENGYSGDGFLCLPIDPCQTNGGGCEDTTMCRYTGPNQRVCLCKFGYENYKPGSGCSLTNVCTSSSCDPNAICETTEPHKFSCTCKEGYSGNGTVCYGNVLERLKDINSNNPRFRQDLLYAINLISKFYTEPLTKHGPFTLFVPTDRAFSDVIRENRGFDKFLDDEDRAMQIMRQHILIGQFRLEDLQDFDTFYTLQGNAALLNVRVARDVFRYKLQRGSDRAKILGRNFIASNGIIHIVNNLLTLEPEILGDKTKTAMDLIKLEGAYNRFQTLIMSAGLSDVFTQPNITVFAPENGAWDALPAGTLDYMMKDDEGKEKLKVILKNHVFPGVLGVTHLINTPHIKSLANIQVKVSVSKLGQVLLDDKVVVSQVNIPCSTGFYHHTEAVIVPSIYDQILPNMCSEVLIKEIKGQCVNCFTIRPPCSQVTDVPTEQRTSCTYISSSRGRRIFYPGCAWICNREVKVPKCCPGFHGAECMPCPGGYKNPCNGRGQCLDGITGSGECVCRGAFVGSACDQCRQKDVFGPHCNESKCPKRVYC